MGVEDVLAVGAQRADALLACEQAECTLREVEQRADAGIGLAVVVAESAFIVALQLSYAIVDAESPIVREGLADFEFDRFVFTLGVLVGVGLAVRIELATERRTGARGLALFEVGAIRQQITRRVKPNIGVHAWEAGASGRIAAGDGREAAELVEGKVGSRIAIGIK